MRRKLSAERIYLGYIFVGLRELLCRFLFLEFVKLEPEGVLEQGAAVASGSEQYPVRFALRDDVVTGLADVRAGEQLFNVAKPDARAVDRVFARPVAKDDALDGDLVEVKLERTIGIIKYDDDRRAIRARHRM